MENKADRIVLERTYNAPIEVVWRAITDREQLKQWYFDFPKEFKLEVGQSFDWHAGDNEHNQWLHRGKMVEIVPGKKLVHTWEYPGYSGTSTVSWELSSVDAKTTKLLFTHLFNIPFDPTMDVFKRENFVQGWDHILNKGLVEFLQKQMS